MLRTIHAGLILALVAVGVAGVLALGPVAARFADWGLPGWFARSTGALHLVAALLLTWRRTMAMGAGVAMSIALGSVFLRTVNGDVVEAFAPTALLAAAVVVAWAATNPPPHPVRGER